MNTGRGSIRTGSQGSVRLCAPDQLLSDTIGNPCSLPLHRRSHYRFPPLCSSPVPCQPAEPSPHNPTDPLFIIPCWNSLLASAPTPKKPLSSWVPGGGNPVLRHRCPGPIQTPLLLELALKPMLDIIQVEGTDRRARDAEGARKRCGLGVGRDHTVLPGKTAANLKCHVRGRSLRERDSPLEAMLGERRSEQQAGFEGSFTSR